MRRSLRFAILALTCAGSALAPAPASAKPTVVATLADLLVLTRPIAGDLLDVKLATRFGQNPHDLEIRPSQILLVKRADILVRNGLDKDPSLAWALEPGSGVEVTKGTHGEGFAEVVHCLLDEG